MIFLCSPSFYSDLCKNTSILGKQCQRHSVILCAQVAFCSVQKNVSDILKTTQGTCIPLYLSDIYCHVQVNWRLFLCISLFLPDVLGFFVLTLFFITISDGQG